MAIFPVLVVESKIQTNEKTRISGVKSYISPDEHAITKVEISPYTTVEIDLSETDHYIDITPTTASDSSLYYLDWQYSDATSTTNLTTAKLRITTQPHVDAVVDDPSTLLIDETAAEIMAVTATSSKDIEVVLPADEKLFSDDNDIYLQDAEAINYCKDGKASLNNYHRFAQAQILDEIYRAGIMDDVGAKLTIADVITTSELSAWSKFMVLRLLYFDISNKKDDVFLQKSVEYGKEELAWRTMTLNNLKIDRDNDGDDSDDQDLASIHTGNLSRR